MQQYSEAAAQAENNIAPSRTGGGTLGTPAAASESTVPGAGVQSYGSIRWGLMSVGIAMAGFVGGLVL